MPFKDAEQCAALSKRSKKRCNNPAVTGSNKCRMHGGKSSSGVAHHNFKTGKFSKCLPDNLAGKYEEAKQDKELNEYRRLKSYKIIDI